MSTEVFSRHNIIDSRSSIPKDNFCLDDLHFQTHTGRSFRISGSGRDAKYHYRHGIVCPLGDIEESLWRQLVLEQIEKEGAMALFEQLKAWQKENCAWLKTKQELEQYTLECFSTRLYDNPKWVDYNKFNRFTTGI